MRQQRQMQCGGARRDGDGVTNPADLGEASLECRDLLALRQHARAHDAEDSGLFFWSDLWSCDGNHVGRSYSYVRISDA